MVLPDKGKASRKTEKHVRSHTFLIAAIAVLAGWVIIAIIWDFYFDLNDDVLMKDILSGTYTGTPESHNIQMLYPISLVISALYSAVQAIVKGADVYGFVLLVLQALSLFLILKRTLDVAGGRRKKDKAFTDYEPLDKGTKFSMAIAGISLAIASLSMLLYHLVYVQYTITVGLLMSAAAFLFATMDLPDCGSVTNSRTYFSDFIKACLPSMILIWISYALRSEMTLLMLPLVLVAALIRCVQLICARSIKELFTKLPLISIAAVLVLTGLGLGATTLADRAAYSDSEWSGFRRWFNARTEVYDYYKIPAYEGNKSFYDSIDMTEEQVSLLENYNFGLDDDINTEKLEKIAIYAKSVWKSEKTGTERIKEAFWNYRTHLFCVDTGLFGTSDSADNDTPYNLLVFGCYLMLFLMAFMDVAARVGGEKNKVAAKAAWKSFAGIVLAELLLFAARSALWMYIMYGGRDPVRITHSLYYCEFVILFALIETYGRSWSPSNRTPDRLTAETILILTSAVFLFISAGEVSDEKLGRGKTNEAYNEYITYCDEHSDSFYFTDVYSTVDFSEKMFTFYPGNAENGDGYVSANHDLAGGWAVKSPLWKSKLERSGLTETGTSALDGTDLSDMAKALLLDKNVYFVSETGSDMLWLENWYKSKGITVSINKVDSIEESFDVYEVD